MTITQYFLTIAPIWQAYFDSKITLSARDTQLAYYRSKLPLATKSQ